MSSGPWQRLYAASLLPGWLSLTGCSDISAVVGRYGADTQDGAASADAGPSEPTRDSVGIESGSRDQFCSGNGSALRAITEGGAGGSACQVPLERRLFAYALCACHDAQLQADTLLVDSFDSRAGAYTIGQGGAAVGINGSLFAVVGSAQLRGSLIVAGENGLTFSGTDLSIEGDLKTNGALDGTGTNIRFGRDVWIGADVRAPGPGWLRVARDAYQTPGHAGLDRLAVGGQTRTADFVVKAPCACEEEALDVAALVAQGHDTADNAEAGFSAVALNSLLELGPKTLPCGRLALDQVAIFSTQSISVPGRTALFVAGNFEVWGMVDVVPGSAGELDVFVAGDLRVWGGAVLGSPTRPAAVRFYVGGQVSVVGSAIVAAQIYAPNATLSITGSSDTYGAVWVDSVDVTGSLKVHYDRAILAASDPCGAPAAQACAGCDQCLAGLSCRAGVCGTCSSDADCCDPRVCSNGECTPLLTEP